MDSEQNIIFILFVVFCGTAVAASLALFARQALIIAYIAIGVAVGPWGLSWVSNTSVLEGISEVGIIFLLFLLGLDLTPQKLGQLFRQTTIVTLISSLVFFAAGWLIARAFGFTTMECVLAGVAAMFSSTIIGIKLLPTTVLHHRHIGELMISVLLLQDMIAIIVMVVLQGMSTVAEGVAGTVVREVALLLLALPALAIAGYVLERFVLLPLLRRFDRVQEYVFLLTIAWCLGIAQLGHALGLSHEMGAFVAGVLVASSPISQYIAISLKPLRDFFLVLFFFSLGARLNLDFAAQVLIPSLVLGAAMLLIKPAVYRFAFAQTSETPKLAWETGFRLGNMSEFSLLVAFLALQSGIVGESAVFMVLLATVITFIGSSTIVVLRFPTPVAVSERLRRD